MLTAEMVAARKYKGELRLQRLDAEGREKAQELAEGYLAIAKEHVGRTREELDAAWDDWDAAHPQRRVTAGLRKLVEDACTFEAEPPVDPVELRQRLFRFAAEARRALPDGERFDRGLALAAVAKSVEMPAEEVDRLLFADTRGAQVLQAAPVLHAAGLVEEYEVAQAQAVLLRAVKITCDVRCAPPAAARAFFRKLKFHQLLFRVEPREEGYRVVVDGPYSLFDAVTRYGVKLALLLPALALADAFSLEADVRWGKAREPLLFRLAGEGGGARADEALPDDVAVLLAALRNQDSPWQAEVATALLDVPGVGLIVPDLVFRRTGFREPIYLEVLGYWSREAVFQRLDVVEAGARDQAGGRAKVLFAVSSRLRVSEEVLPDDASSALYVYKGVMSARAVLERVAALSQRTKR